MTKYIHDEWCDVNLAAPSECSCYVRLIEALEGMVAYLEGSIPDDPRAEADLIDARRIRQERDDAVLAHHLALARIEALEPLARYGEAQLHREYEDEAGIESILSATRGIPSAHRSFDAFKVKKLAALAAKEKKL